MKGLLLIVDVVILIEIRTHGHIVMNTYPTRIRSETNSKLSLTDNITMTFCYRVHYYHQHYQP